VRPLHLLVAGCFVLAAAAARDSSAESTAKTPVTIGVVGKGSIRLLVADGAARPCDVSDNRVLFNGHVKAGDEIKVTSMTGSVCVDHTFGAFRESQWAGASIWSGSGAGWTGTRSLAGSVSTDEP
jgi:hypothetical protein